MLLVVIKYKFENTSENSEGFSMGNDRNTKIWWFFDFGIVMSKESRK